MKKTVTRKLMPMALAFLVVLGLSACGTGKPAESDANISENAGTSTTDTASTDTADKTVDPLGKYEEPITITWAVQTAAASKLLDNDTWEDNRWSRLIKEKLNINLEIAFSADSSTDAYKNKLNAVIASGDLPDIFKTQDPDVFLQLAQNGQLADLTDIYEKYATDSVKAYREKFADAYEGASINGKLYAIPRMNDNWHQAPFLWIRDDWLKNTNMQPPKTVDEMVELAKIFATGDPDGNGVNGDTYGLALNKDLIRQQHASIIGLASAFGVPGRQNSVFYRNKDGKITFPWIQQEMKPVLTLLNEMYNDGLINKEFTAKNESALVEDITSGKIGMAYGPNWGLWYPYNNVYKKDGVITRPYAIPTQPGYDYKIGYENNAVGQMTMVSATCKHPEAAIKILNLYDQVVNYGTEEDYLRYWADEQYRLCPVYIDIPNEVYEKEVLEALDKGTGEGLPSFAKKSYDYVAGFNNGSLKSDDNALGTWGQMDKQGSLQYVLNKYMPEGAMVQSIVGIQKPEVWLTNTSTLETLTVTAFTDMITGTKPISYFDEYVKQWLDAGGQQTLDELEKMYPAK